MKVYVIVSGDSDKGADAVFTDRDNANAYAWAYGAYIEEFEADEPLREDARAQLRQGLSLYEVTMDPDGNGVDVVETWQRPVDKGLQVISEGGVPRRVRGIVYAPDERQAADMVKKLWADG